MSNRSVKGWEARRDRDMRRKSEHVSDICPGWLQPSEDRSHHIVRPGAQAVLDSIFSEGTV